MASISVQKSIVYTIHLLEDLIEDFPSLQKRITLQGWQTIGLELEQVATSLSSAPPNRPEVAQMAVQRIADFFSAHSELGGWVAEQADLASDASYRRVPIDTRPSDQSREEVMRLVNKMLQTSQFIRQANLKPGSKVDASPNEKTPKSHER